MHRFLLLLASLLVATGLNAQALPKVATGTVERFANFSSKYVAPRNVDVWLPEGYSPKKKYAVLYMHDGQSLFDSTITWNHQEWGVDETMGRLMAEGKIRDCIVVGIWNNGNYRHAEYFPEKPYRKLTQEQIRDLLRSNQPMADNPLFTEGPLSDRYLKFLVEELKPFIDRHYATRRNRRNTFVAGSSMGGLISWYAMCEYPRVFGGAACLSTHWTGIFRADDNPIPAAFLSYLKTHLPAPKNHLLYFDHGTETLDALYAPFQEQADAIARAAGYTDARLLTKVFPGADHSERAWESRLAIPLAFLLANDR